MNLQLFAENGCSLLVVSLSLFQYSDALSRKMQYSSCNVQSGREHCLCLVQDCPREFFEVDTITPQCCFSISKSALLSLFLLQATNYILRLTKSGTTFDIFQDLIEAENEEAIHSDNGNRLLAQSGPRRYCRVLSDNITRLLSEPPVDEERNAHVHNKQTSRQVDRSSLELASTY